MAKSSTRIAGRSKEVELLTELRTTRRASLLALYGRRRVGKTYLIREFFGKEPVYFEVTGTKDGKLKDQLQTFYETLISTFPSRALPPRPRSWREALSELTRQLDLAKPSAKKVVFLDELPWLATRRSGLLQQIDYFWNRHWSSTENLIVVLCGSAASWMLEKLIQAKGGLHNRITHRISLEPLTLGEAKNYLAFRGVRMSNQQVTELYMALGGVPYYLDQAKKGRSAAQVVDHACFSSLGVLVDEYGRLFSSLFSEAEVYHQIAITLSGHRYGLTRSRLLKKVSLPSGGRSFKRLDELEQAGFIVQLPGFGRASDPICRLSDEFLWFHFNWIADAPKTTFLRAAKDYWVKMRATSKYSVWAGYVFEMICLKHAYQIAKALDIGSIGYQAGWWSFSPRAGTGEKGAQIDLLFDRDDDVVSICELKYHSSPIVIDRKYARDLEQKLEVFEKRTGTKKSLQLVLVSKAGLKENSWSRDLLAHHLSLDALFASMT